MERAWTNFGGTFYFREEADAAAFRDLFERETEPRAERDAMTEKKRVTVHHFKRWDINEDDYIVPARKRTSERITEIDGEIIPGTAEEVDEADLDEQGRYDPAKR